MLAGGRSPVVRVRRVYDSFSARSEARAVVLDVELLEEV